MKYPLQSLSREPVPLDVSYLPSVFVVGMGKSGKTSLAKELNKRQNLVHIKVAHVIREFMQNPFSATAQEMVRCLKNGEKVDDKFIVRLLKQRLQQKDVL